MFVQILPNPAVAGDEAKEKASGVQTSEGDKFTGDTVDLPKDEAALLIAMNRAKQVDVPKVKKAS